MWHYVGEYGTKMHPSLMIRNSTVFPRIVSHVTLNETKRIRKILFSKKTRDIWHVTNTTFSLLETREISTRALWHVSTVPEKILIKMFRAMCCRSLTTWQTKSHVQYSSIIAQLSQIMDEDRPKTQDKIYSNFYDICDTILNM